MSGAHLGLGVVQILQRFWSLGIMGLEGIPPRHFRKAAKAGQLGYFDVIDERRVAYTHPIALPIL